MAVTEQVEFGKRLTDGRPDEVLARAQDAAAHAVRAGEFAPTFRLPDVHGGNQALLDLIERGPLLLSFYRGIWCEFCDAMLVTLGGLDEDIRALGANHVAIGPAPSSNAERIRLKAFPMPVLIDRALKVTISYGLVFSLPAQLRERYARLGCVPGKICESGEWKISVPSTYLIGMDGRVTMTIIDADIRTRMQADHLLSALQGVLRR